jgi:hypothetical protein
MSTFLFGILKEEPELLCDITLKKKTTFCEFKNERPLSSTFPEDRKKKFNCFEENTE